MQRLILLSVSAACALMSAVPAHAQQYAGTYTMTNAQGGVVTVTLRHGADGSVTGSLSGGDAQFQIEGVVEEGAAVGVITSAEGGVFFQATLDGDRLTLVLIEAGAGNAPDYSTARTLVLSRASHGSGASGRNPLAGGGADDPAVGAFSGEGVALTLGGAGGTYRGTLVFQGASYPVEARGSGGRLEGSFAADGQRFPFTAVVQGSIMRFESGGTSYALTRQGAAPSTNPLAGGGAKSAPTPGAAGSLLGQWRCQTPQGMAQLSFVSDRELIYNGERSPYQLGQGVIRVPGEWGPQDYRFALEGSDRLTVTNPDGSVTRCQRQQSGAGGGLEALLQGPRCAYSSSPDGGYSTLYKLVFDGRGRFVSGTESSYSGDPGFAYGLERDPNAGTYQVTGAGNGSPIYLTWPDGSTGTAAVHHGDEQTIREFYLEGRLYAAELCQ